MTAIQSIGEQRVVLEPISWQTYLALAAESQTGGRMTYDQGVLEIMSPMLSHESAKSLLGRMIARFAEIRGIDIRSSASTTFRRSDLEKGFEPDESYYIRSFQLVCGKAEVDLSIDPPPDLVIEIEMTRSSIRKLLLFAAIEIPEVWRYDGQQLWIGCLENGCYLPQTGSKMLPGFPIDLAAELLEVRASTSETVLMRRFVEIVNRADS